MVLAGNTVLTVLGMRVYPRTPSRRPYSRLNLIQVVPIKSEWKPAVPARTIGPGSSGRRKSDVRDNRAKSFLGLRSPLKRYTTAA